MEVTSDRQMLRNAGGEIGNILDSGSGFIPSPRFMSYERPAKLLFAWVACFCSCALCTSEIRNSNDFTGSTDTNTMVGESFKTSLTVAKIYLMADFTFVWLVILKLTPMIRIILFLALKASTLPKSCTVPRLSASRLVLSSICVAINVPSFK